MSRADLTPISSLVPVLSPELEMGVDDNIGVKETLLAIRLNCVVEEDSILSSTTADIGVEADIKGKLERYCWSEYCIRGSSLTIGLVIILERVSLAIHNIGSYTAIWEDKMLFVSIILSYLLYFP